MRSSQTPKTYPHHLIKVHVTLKYKKKERIENCQIVEQFSYASKAFIIQYLYSSSLKPLSLFFRICWIPFFSKFQIPSTYFSSMVIWTIKLTHNFLLDHFILTYTVKVPVYRFLKSIINTKKTSWKSTAIIAIIIVIANLGKIKKKKKLLPCIFTHITELRRGCMIQYSELKGHIGQNDPKS